MSALAGLPAVAECTVTGCSYNHDGCHAPAVTIGGTDGDAECQTFIPLSIDGGLPIASASVGACQRSECVFNDKLTCTADAVKVGSHGSGADCLTYSAA